MKGPNAARAGSGGSFSLMAASGERSARGEGQKGQRGSLSPGLIALLARVRFDERGLVPVVAQEVDGTVLMLAWANREALLATATGGRATYWSRSREELWRKGDTSGHVQKVRAMALDCDGDEGAVRRAAEGRSLPQRDPELLLGEGGDLMADERFLARLWATIESRKADEGASGSYTRALLAAPPKIRRKIIEEAYEVNEAHQALADGQDTKDHLAHEAADLIYHLMVLLSSADVTPAEVYAVLERRHEKPSGQRSGTP